MPNLRNRIVRAEVLLRSTARHCGKMRVSGMTQAEARWQMLRELRKAAANANAPDHLKIKLEQAADRMAAHLESQ